MGHMPVGCERGLGTGPCTAFQAWVVRCGRMVQNGVEKNLGAPEKADFA